MKSPSARRPVFLDSTGRRHRTIRRTGALLVVPAVGYLILLVSSLLGGPSLDTPLVPLPEAGRPAPRPVTPAPEAVQSVRPSETTTSPRESEPTTRPTSTPITPSTTPSAVPVTVAPTPTTGSPTTTPGRPTTAHASNKPTAPPGRTKSPSKP